MKHFLLGVGCGLIGSATATAVRGNWTVAVEVAIGLYLILMTMLEIAKGRP